MIGWRYGKEYDGDKVTLQVGAEDAGCGRTDTAGSAAAQSERGTGGRACNLLAANRLAHRERCADCRHRHLPARTLCVATRRRHSVARQRRHAWSGVAGLVAQTPQEGI